MSVERELRRVRSIVYERKNKSIDGFVGCWLATFAPSINRFTVDWTIAKKVFKETLFSHFECRSMSWSGIR